MPGSGLPFELSASVMSRAVTAKASSLSAIWTVPGAAVCTDFIVGMGTLAFLVAGSRCQAWTARRRRRPMPAPSATMPIPAAVAICWAPCRVWP